MLLEKLTVVEITSDIPNNEALSATCEQMTKLTKWLYHVKR